MALFQDSRDDLQEFDDDTDNDDVRDDKLHSSSESTEGDDDLNSGIKKFNALFFVLVLEHKLLQLSQNYTTTELWSGI